MHPTTKEVYDAQLSLEFGAVMAFKVEIFYAYDMLMIGGIAAAHSGAGIDPIARVGAN